MINNYKKGNIMGLLKKGPYKSVSCGPYRLDFYFDEKKARKGDARGTYLRVATQGNDEGWQAVIPGNTHSFGYLLAAAEKGYTERLRAYAQLLWTVSMIDTTEQEVDNELWEAVMNWHRRRDAEAADKAAAVTEPEEMANQALMEEVVKGTDEGFREAVKEEIEGNFEEKL